jgi:hypothetical protein
VLCCCPGKGSFFKSHVDTPRSEKIFGSLVAVFPTFHEGGALLLRHHDHKWIFDSGQVLAGAANNQLSIGYWNTVRHAPTLGDDDDAALTTLNNSGPCVTGEFRSVLEMLEETLEETQTWYVFCMNPNDLQLLNQLEGCLVKGQIRSLGLTEIAQQCVNVFEVGTTPGEFCDRYQEKLLEWGLRKANQESKLSELGRHWVSKIMTFSLVNTR